MPGSVSPALRAAAALLLLAAGATGVGAQQRVGISSAVNTQSQATLPGAQPKRIAIGQDVVFNERITTDPTGQTQLLFLDESAMTIGPNSDLTIDQFVYDPKTDTGKLAMSATRGLMRYVGGKLSKHDQAVTLRTGTATLAVRGGVFILNFEPDGNTQVIFVFGHRLQITGRNGIVETLSRSGFEVVIGRTGIMSPPQPVPATQMAALMLKLDGRTGGNGGAPVIPTATFVLNSGITEISNGLVESIQQAEQNSGDNAFAPQPKTYNSALYPTLLPIPGTAAAVTTAPLSRAESAGQIIVVCSGTDPTACANATTIGTTTSGQPVGGPNSGPPIRPPSSASLYAGRLKRTNNPALGFYDNTAANDIAYAGGTLTNGTFTGSFGALGVIAFPLAPGFASLQGSASGLGSFTGTSFLAADNSFFYANIRPTSQPTQPLFIFGGTPVNAGFYQPTGASRTFAFTVQPDGVLQSTIPFIRNQAGGNLANATVSPLYVVAPPTTPIGAASTVSAARALQASLAISGQGPNQQSVIAVTAGEIGTLQSSGQPILTGQMRGSSLLSAAGTPVPLRSAVSSTADANGGSFYGGSAPTGFVLDQTAYSSSNGSVGSPVLPSTASEGTTSYGFAQPALAAPLPGGVPASRTTQAQSGYFGGLMYPAGQTTPDPYIVTGGTLVTTDAPNSRIQADLTGGAPSLTSLTATPSPALSMQYGSLTGPAGAQAFVDDNTFAAMENQAASPNSTGYFVSSGAAGIPAALLQQAGATACQCQYLKWGYWGGNLQMTSATDPAFPRVDAAHINTWVAGVATPLGDLNSLMSQSATASYTGHAIGSVFNNGQSYLAAGGFNGSYNFGTQTGTWAVTNFDGHSFGGTGQPLVNGATYSFGINSAGVVGAINGTFYGPMAAETGGNFAVHSAAGFPTYLASGIFAGKQ